MNEQIDKDPGLDAGEWPSLKLRDEDDLELAASVCVMRQDEGRPELHTYISRQHSYTADDLDALAWVFGELAARMRRRGTEWL